MKVESVLFVLGWFLQHASIVSFFFIFHPVTVNPILLFWRYELPSIADNRDVSVVSITFVVKTFGVELESVKPYRVEKNFFFTQARELFHARSELRPFQAVRPSLMSNKLVCQANRRSLKKVPVCYSGSNLRLLKWNSV